MNIINEKFSVMGSLIIIIHKYFFSSAFYRYEQ